MRTWFRPLAASLCFVSLMVLGSRARADETPPSPPPPASEEPSKPYDYTAPMIATDVLLMGAFAGSWTLGRAEAVPDGVGVAGAVGSYAAFVASGAVYHALFDTRKKTGLSIVVRALAPAVFGLAGAATVHDSESARCEKRSIAKDDCDHDGTEVGALLGALIGMAGATVADAAILVPDGAKRPPPPKTAGVSMAPSFAAARGGGQIGLVGTF